MKQKETKGDKTEAFVTDLKSMNKTRVGKTLKEKNNKARPYRQVAIKSGEFVTFGGVHCRFYFAQVLFGYCCFCFWLFFCLFVFL